MHQNYYAFLKVYLGLSTFYSAIWKLPFVIQEVICQTPVTLKMHRVVKGWTNGGGGGWMNDGLSAAAAASCSFAPEGGPPPPGHAWSCSFGSWEEGGRPWIEGKGHSHCTKKGPAHLTLDNITILMTMAVHHRFGVSCILFLMWDVCA